MQASITIPVIDTYFRFPHIAGMLTHDDIREELIRQLKAKRVTGVGVAKHLGITGSRVTEIKTYKRRVQPEEMAPLAALLGMEGEIEPEADDPWQPREETIRLALEYGLLSLTEPRATKADLPILAHGVSAVLKFAANHPAKEDSPGFPEAAFAIVETAIRHYKPPPAPEA